MIAANTAEDHVILRRVSLDLASEGLSVLCTARMECFGCGFGFGFRSACVRYQRKRAVSEWAVDLWVVDGRESVRISSKSEGDERLEALNGGRK